MGVDSQSIVVSGMRPTGSLHLGHLKGVLENWLCLQKECECFFMIADWHALMGQYMSSSRLEDIIYDNVADWLSVGVDPEKSTIFIQSSVPEHLDLYMYFSLLTPVPWLMRCPTFKELQSLSRQVDLNTFAFLGYPALQAADIALYKGTHVPVGHDQLPHLELAREVIRRFHHIYGKEVFPEPQPLESEQSKLMGLDGHKMSKSLDNTILIDQQDPDLDSRVNQMLTDTHRVRLSDLGHPDECQVFRYYEVFASDMNGEVRQWCEKALLGCRDCKHRLAVRMNDIFAPIREKKKNLLSNKIKIKNILEEGKAKASLRARQTIEEVRSLLKHNIL